MSEKNTIFDNVLMMRAILEGGQEEVPAHVWDAVSDRLDKAAGIRSGKTVTLWWRRAGIAVAAAAAAVASVLMIERTENADIVPTDVHGDMIAVVTPEEVVTENAEDKFETVVSNVSGAELLAYVPSTVEEEVLQSEETVPQQEQVESTTSISDTKPAETKVREVRHDEFQESGSWKEETPSRRIKTSLVVSGITGSSNSQSSNGDGILKAPAVILKPTQTGIEEKESQTKYDIPVSVGAGVKFELTRRWSLGVGLNYTNLTRTLKGTYTHVNEEGSIDNLITSDIRNTQHYIGLPVNAYFNIVNSKHVNFYTYAGGTLEKCVSDKYLILTNNITHKEAVKGVQLSTNVGIGAEFMLGKHLGLYVDPSLRYYFDCDQPRSIRTAQPLMFGVELGLRFKL